jgi:hypothetical protein
MLFTRKDYNGRIIDTENKIPEDMPAFLFLASDIHAPNILLHYARKMRENGAGEMAASAELQAKKMLQWQKEKGYKIANAPEGALIDDGGKLPVNEDPYSDEDYSLDML